MANHRDAQITLIIGRNGTGKSTLCEKIIKASKARAIAVTYNGMPKIWRSRKLLNLKDYDAVKKHKKGIRQVIAAKYERPKRGTDLFQFIYDHYFDGTIIFDDCRSYITSNIDTDEYFRKLLLDFRHRMLDMYFVVHSPSDVPPRVWGFTSTVWVGSTASILKPSQANIDSESVARIAYAQKAVNELFRAAKAKGDNSHYGIFKRVQV